MFKPKYGAIVREFSAGLKNIKSAIVEFLWGKRSKVSPNRDLFIAANGLLVVASFAILAFSFILVKSFGVSLPSSPELSDLSKAGFSFTNTAHAAEPKSEKPSAVLHLHKGSYWILQSTKDVARAEEVVQQCAKHGLKANYYQVVLNGENFYRVLLSNRFESNADAKESRSLLPEAHEAGAWVIDLKEAIVVWE